SAFVSAYGLYYYAPRRPHPCPTRRSSDLLGRHRTGEPRALAGLAGLGPPGDDRALSRRAGGGAGGPARGPPRQPPGTALHRRPRSEEHTSELQSRENLVCRLLPEKKKIEK